MTEHSLAQLQRRVFEFEQAKGLLEQTSLDKSLLLGEEVGELFKAIRKARGLACDRDSVSHDVGHELADVLVYLLAIANRFEIDLETAFVDKLAINMTREWHGDST